MKLLKVVSSTKYCTAILRLPPYHCKLNPIEFVWGQIKKFVGAINSIFKMNDETNIF